MGLSAAVVWSLRPHISGGCGLKLHAMEHPERCLDLRLKRSVGDGLSPSAIERFLAPRLLQSGDWSHAVALGLILRARRIDGDISSDRRGDFHRANDDHRLFRCLPANPWPDQAKGTCEHRRSCARLSEAPARSHFRSYISDRAGISLSGHKSIGHFRAVRLAGISDFSALDHGSAFGVES